MTALPSVVDPVRIASRRIVRALGFMGGPFAGTDLSPSAVHALIEIEACEGLTANDLGARLRLEKSSVSRMLRKLVLSGDVTETAEETDGRRKRLSLSAAGRERVAAIHDFARTQVVDALARLQPGQDRIVLDGLRLYAGALADDVTGRPSGSSHIDIASGYRTGLIACITQMHALYYARTSGFGRRFESVVAGGLAAFCDRLDNPANAIWVAMRAGEIVGSVAIDGEDMAQGPGPGIAHLRWFIVDDSVRGGGVGRRLIASALAFADDAGFAETHLWTFAGLTAARHLYEANGFDCVEERRGAQWGKEVLEQRFVRKRP
ncbi:bifunctional helix-turn-helix transcriptional regulator/GNAT family N-acetyltransferase [Chelatococcus asaccharovorans]|uniref:bifunctional helix-turn-helix transcriptional regulator/GNAT family N-acetyltransferase n=1 Tax=Chelatococcus asaccharovorans TaxID=28210 RepID=UPI00224C74D6|nr:helix-turn-helix domain-containing GNAT family N-acetyltransferase [Chelatococcus asaccharovorans]CAH1665706.1 MarR family transcriptional regulator with acetyltransferase activity [Chelatococcus asaccharovorans]CAH1681823.1 MarR family transcriptional regulator with acetyltransferase activity [Chelatococcus asaccharovorans]